jgi:phosphoglycolate phosphatase
MMRVARGTVIFDLDGTLVDSAPDLAFALDAVLVARGAEPLGLEVGRSFIGHGIPRLVQQGLAARGLLAQPLDLVQATEQFLQIYAQNLTRQTRPYPGARMALERLREQGWRLAVCTNKQETASRAILRALDLAEYFEQVVGPDTFGVSKPDPRPLRGCIPSGDFALLVGDSSVDIEAARAAGIPVILVDWGYGDTSANAPFADAVVASFDSIPRAVADLQVRHENSL